MTEVREAPPMEIVPRDLVQAVEVHELRKVFKVPDRKKGRFGRKTRVALDGVSFTIERGETVAILGQNGSGKSTLVRLLSTLLLPDGGSARIFGHDVVTDARPVRRLVNRVSVEASFFKKMSSAENLSYAARYYGMSAGQTRHKIPAILERVGFPVGSARRVDGEPLARDAAEGRTRAGVAHVAGRAAAGRADDRVSTLARSSRCRTSSERSARTTTRRSSSARTT